MKICKVYEGEGVKVLLFSLLGALLQAGVAIGFVAADSLFLIHRGAQKLPYVYFLLPLVMLFIAPIVSFMTRKVGVSRFQVIASFVFFLGCLLMYFCESTASTGGPSWAWLYYVIKIYSSVCYITVYTVFWNFVDEYFDILSAKRLFPVLSGANSLGSTAGGYFVTLFMDYNWQVAHLFLIWGFLSLVSILFTRRISAFVSCIETADDEEATFLEQMKVLASTYKKSKYVVFLTLSAFSVMFITHLCEFQYMRVFEQQYSNENELANLFGYLFMCVNIFNTIVTFFLFNRLVANFGMRNTTLIQPTVYILSFTLYVLCYGQSESMFLAAIFAFFAFQGIQTVVEYNNYNLILNPVPREMKSSIRAITEGWIEPGSGALAGLVLILLAQSLHWNHLQISSAAIGLSCIYLAVALCVRHLYTGAMIQNLRSEWLDFSRTETEIFGGLDPQEIETLAQSVLRGEIADKGTACRILWVNDRLVAVRTLLGLLEHSSEEDVEPLCEILADVLVQRDAEIIHIVIDWLMRHDDTLGTAVIQELGKHNLIPAEIPLGMLRSDDHEARGAASAVLWNSWNLDNKVMAMSTLRALLDGNVEERLIGIRSLGRTGQSRNAGYLVPYLQDLSLPVRRAAKLAIARLVGPDSSHLLDNVLEMVWDVDDEVRAAGIKALGQIGESNSIPPLLLMADALSPFERRQVNQIILSFGLRSVPACVRVVQDVSYPYAGRSIAARALARLAFPQLQALGTDLTAREVLRAYQMLYYHTVLAQESDGSIGVEVLSRFYQDEPVTTLEFVLEILALGGQMPNHEMIASSLRSSSLKTRSNAIETLEQAVSRPLFRMLLPLVDGRTVDDKLRFYFNHFHAEPLLPMHVIDLALASNTILERAAAVQAKWDMALSASHAGHGGNAAESSTAVLKQLVFSQGKGPRLVQEMVFSILDRAEGRRDLENTMERIALFARTDEFSKIQTEDLCRLVEQSVRVEFKDRETICVKGNDLDTLYVIRDGRVLLRNGTEQVRTRCHAIGEEVLAGGRSWNYDAIADGPLSLFRLDRQALLHCARLYPRIALGFLEKEMNVLS